LTGDDQAVLDLREHQEQITAQIEEKREVVQSTAINMATNSEVTEVEVIAPAAPKPRRSVWKWQMVDERAATRCGFTKVIPNEEEIDKYFKSVDKKNISEEGFTQFGIKIYLEKSY